ncbi:thiamine phosphate synthase [Anaerotalea alkaliphila]|uniref:Thiamine phosphate synthase n=1 Tax=Anaerotalea alkaliphila TaxID=2662126 RepID=A0A7X5HXT6_9FIRM|nr:thiamine phosphate synthase [Anaerotalea alkaliphila]NDL68634.1 thiamine phosphate synthase [Anaerotalea alkaliphila]
MRICVTNRHLCQGDFFSRVERIARSGPWAIILREKDLQDDAYEEMAKRCLEIASHYGVPLIVHTKFQVAKRLGVCRIHMPYASFQENPDALASFEAVGVSVLTVEEAIAAESAGAAYLIAGHVFATDCKRDLEPRGLDFLKSVCAAVEIPVYAIGGVTEKNYSSVRLAGASGFCIMSGCMRD